MRLSTLRAANVLRQKEWNAGSEGQTTLSYSGNELAGEVGEACNVIKKLERERLGRRGSRATLQDLADELADVLICVDLVALKAGINMETAVREKFNATSAKYGLNVFLGEDEPARFLPSVLP
jgi:NTP pyrophosphatase (non-canonical NTP hydrolase)